MEGPEKGDTAESCARYFSLASTQASAHLCVDNNSIIQCVKDNDVAWAAPGCNHDGIQIELAGYAKQSKKEWFDSYSVHMLSNASIACAQYCLKYGIVPRFIDHNGLFNKLTGITGHIHVNRAYGKSNHIDPGINFPWSYFITLVNAHFGVIKSRI